MRAGDRLQDRYLLQEPLGEGGMAEVWLARDERLQRAVAIKILDNRLADSPEFLVRFFSEAQAAARISHPGVVGVLDFGRTDESPYLVMEYVSGGSLSEAIDGPMLPDNAVHTVAQAAAGAGALHAAGLVHRDIKPANILLDETGRVRVTDLGIAARSNSESLTGTDSAIGSPHYMSPERINGGEDSPAADVYALGVVLYELLTGVKPFNGNSITAVAVSHLEHEPEPPSALISEVPPWIDDIVMRCLAKDPVHRFTDGTELSETLRSATPSPRPQRSGALVHARRFTDAIPRPPRVFSGAVLITLLLGTAGLAITFGGTTEDTSNAEAGVASPSPRTSDPADPSTSPSAQDEEGTVMESVTTSTEPSKESKETKTQRDGSSDGDEKSPTPTPTSAQEEEEDEEKEPSPEPSSTPSAEPTPEASPAQEDATPSP